MPEFNIDPAFSVYNLVQRKIDSTRQISHRRTMSHISHIIEEVTRSDHHQNVIFSAFQYMSKFPPQIARYRQLAQHAKHVYVFGVPDEVMPPIENLTYVPLEPDFQLTREWFIVSHGAHFSTALATEELSDFNEPDHKRQFKGVWLIDDPLIEIMCDWLNRIVGERAESDTTADKNSQQYQQALANVDTRLQSIIARDSIQPPVANELQSFLQNTVEPAFA